ncbi:MAG: TIGR00725 family protein [Firmicutes bacterium]|nr:TIGR00725 family protein [Bacillota bacterium]
MGRSGWYVAVVGSSDCDEEVARLAYRVGYELARRQATIICGGKGGVMSAAARGARDGGGRAVGILPGTNRTEANEYLDIAIATGLGDARNAVIACAADVVIAVGGGFGTLSEVALALKKDKPVIGLSFSFPEVPGLIHAKTPAEAVELAMKNSL